MVIEAVTLMFTQLSDSLAKSVSSDRKAILSQSAQA
jgi:hypothetical protein